MERMPLDVPYGGRRCEYDNINVHDVVIYAEPQHKLLFRVVRGGGDDF
jgi:hypothetical protein